MDMGISKNAVDARLRKMRRRAELMSEDQGVAFRQLLDAVVEVIGGEVAELREEVGSMGRKLDSHVSTLRTDVSHLRQAVRKGGDGA